MPSGFVVWHELGLVTEEALPWELGPQQALSKSHHDGLPDPAPLCLAACPFLL